MIVKEVNCNRIRTLLVFFFINLAFFNVVKFTLTLLIDTLFKQWIFNCHSLSRICLCSVFNLLSNISNQFIWLLLWFDDSASKTIWRFSKIVKWKCKSKCSSFIFLRSDIHHTSHCIYNSITNCQTKPDSSWLRMSFINYIDKHREQNFDLWVWNSSACVFNWKFNWVVDICWLYH